MSQESVHLLNQASGYGVLVGVGALFAIGMISTTKFLGRYLHEDSGSTEVFMVANRQVGTPLLASSVYSSWSWATELLMVCAMVYNYGVMSSYWYGAGLAIQICLMALLGIEAKKKTPNCHTSLEIVGARYGTACHILFTFLCLANNLLACCSMIVAAASAISVIADNLHIVASTMLIPFGVLLYTTVGGLKATFLTDFVHTLVLLIILCYVNTSVVSSKEIGGIYGLYDLVTKHEGDRYVKGNFEGSFLTGKSQGGIFFGLVLAIGNFGLTVMDSSFWQKSFSANVKASFPGYIIATIFIFANVWGIGSLVGLASIVLEKNPIFPTYPRAMTTYEVSSGYNLPFTVKALLGNGGVGAILLSIYLAATSTVSAQMISVSSILSFDIYRKYIKPTAGNKEMIRVSHLGVISFGLFSGGFSVMLHYVGVNMTWLNYFIAMIICPVFTITWSRQTKLAAFVSPIVGLIASLVVWITTAYHYEHKVTLESLEAQLPSLFGSLTALFLPGLLSIIISLTVKPYKFDWNDLNKMTLIESDKALEEKSRSGEMKDKNLDANAKSQMEAIPESEEDRKEQKENENVRVDFLNPESSTRSDEEEPSNRFASERKLLNFYSKLAYGAFFTVLLVTWVLWPLPLYRNWIWSKAYFSGYVAVSFVWVYGALLIIGIYPLISGRHSIAKVFRGVYKDISKRTKK